MGWRDPEKNTFIFTWQAYPTVTVYSSPLFADEWCQKAVEPTVFVIMGERVCI